MADGISFNSAFFEALGQSVAVTELVRSKAEEIAATARSTAPVRTGDYRRGITVRMKEQRRSVALIVGTDKKTMIIESRTGNLVRALNAHKRGGRG